MQCKIHEIMNDAALLVRLKLDQSLVVIMTMNNLGFDCLVFVDKGQI